MEFIKPPLKWVGGKTQIIDSLIQKFPKNIHNYHEIFLGGGSVLLAVLSSDIKINNNICAYDLNNELICLYIHIRDNPEKLIQKLEELKKEFNKIKGDVINRKPSDIKEAMTSQESFYYWIRQEYNKIKNNNIKKSAMFVFLNKTCFRGMFREGPNGFNVPFGHYKNPSIYDKEHINKVSKLIQNVQFVHADFTKSFKNINNKDFVYLDPPYVPENKKSFVGYNKNGFNKHEELFTLTKNLKAKFIMSNSNTKLVNDSFEKYNVVEIDCRRAINSKKPQSKTKEVIISSID